jgi:hypothetical protein
MIGRVAPAPVSKIEPLAVGVAQDIAARRSGAGRIPAA